MKVLSALLLLVLSTSAFCSMMLTPSGLFHKSCLHQLDGEDGVLHPQGNGDMHIKYHNGSVNIFSACSYPSKRAIEMTDGWVLDTYYGANIFTSFNGSWNVPTAPSKSSGQTIFTFTGLEGTYESNLYIIQPVLQWGSSGAGGGKYWAIASWYAFASSGFYSPVKTVSAGNTIVGDMVFNSGNQTWTISSVDKTSGVSSVLNVALPNTQTQYAYVTLEIVSVTACNQYPSGSVVYNNLAMSNGATAYTASWTPQSTAQCSESITVNSASSVTIAF